MAVRIVNRLRVKQGIICFLLFPFSGSYHHPHDICAFAFNWSLSLHSFNCLP